MKNQGFVACIAAWGLVLGTCGADREARADPPSDAREGADDDAILEALVKAHNEERAKESLPPLMANAKLESAALAHVRDMAEHATMTHEGSDRSTPLQRIVRQKYLYQAIAENVAVGQRGVPQVMRAWMNSPEHKEHILGKYTEIGGAMARDKDGRIYWCVDFGRPWPVLEPDRASSDLVEAVNQERSKADRPPMKANRKLQAAAQRHARDMAATEKLGPKDADGLTPVDRAKKEGYRFQRISEDSASGQTTPQELVQTWVDDASHRENLLGDFSEIGVGYAPAANGVPYWCVLIALPAR